MFAYELVNYLLFFIIGCYILDLAIKSYHVDSLFVWKEWRREDGAHKKVHLQTLGYSAKAIGADVDAHFFAQNNDVFNVIDK